MFKIKQVNFEFAPIWRVFLSGSSSAGKTYFARLLLETELIDFERVYYYHPDINETKPTNWAEHLSKPILFQVGLPSLQDLLELPPKTCVILDDLFREASASRNIDYLFRVLSGKRYLHVIIMTQRYFAGGPYSLSIRNSSNYHILMNNADCRINERAANRLGLKAEFTVAQKYNQTKLYPYIFIDQTNQARVLNLQVYTDILSQHKKVVSNSMIYYLVAERDFISNCEKIDSTTAKYADSKQKTIESRDSTSTSKRDTKTETESKQTTNKRKIILDKTIDSDVTESNRKPSGAFKRYLERRKIERAVEQTLQRHNRSSKL